MNGNQVRMTEAKDAIVKLADAAGCAVAVSGGSIMMYLDTRAGSPTLQFTMP